MPTQVHIVKTMVFPVVMYGCESDHKEGWVPKNWYFWTIAWEKSLESPLEIKPVNPKGNQSWILIGRTDVEAPILWPPDAKGWLIGKDPDGWERLRAGGEGDDRGWDGWMVGWHHWLSGHEFEQALGDGEGQESLACCSLWGWKELDMTDQQRISIWL